MKPTFSDLLHPYSQPNIYVGERESMIETELSYQASQQWRATSPDFSLICEARVNGKRCLAFLIWEVT
jgi:hypothetical protein